MDPNPTEESIDVREFHTRAFVGQKLWSWLFDRRADRGVRFDSFHTSDSPCLPFRTALATAGHGSKSGVVTHHGYGQCYDDPGVKPLSRTTVETGLFLYADPDPLLEYHRETGRSETQNAAV